MNNIFKLKAKDYLDTGANKVIFNREHFTESARRYDLATRLMSLMQDAKWKRQLIDQLPEYSDPSCLDLATGTGDVAFLLAEKFPSGRITGIDITEAMLAIARQRNKYRQVSFANHDISELPYPSDSFQVISGSYALRNSPDIAKTLAEIYRCLSENGIANILDFAKPEAKFLQVLQFYLLKLWGSFWGIVLHGNPEVHGYISASLKTYPKPSVLDQLIKSAGFRTFQRKKIFFGMIEIISLFK